MPHIQELATGTLEFGEPVENHFEIESADGYTILRHKEGPRIQENDLGFLIPVYNGPDKYFKLSREGFSALSDVLLDICNKNKCSMKVKTPPEDSDFAIADTDLMQQNSLLVIYPGEHTDLSRLEDDTKKAIDEGYGNCVNANEQSQKYKLNSRICLTTEGHENIYITSALAKMEKYADRLKLATSLKMLGVDVSDDIVGNPE